jgi:glycosyltransferase involved in cell wall biosynthesis
MKILLIKAKAESHVYSQFVHALHGALLELGHVAAISDQSIEGLDGAEPIRRLIAELQATRYDAVVSFSSLYGGVTYQGVGLFDALGVKFAGWQVDHPVHMAQCLAPSQQNRCAIFSNHNHVRFSEALKLPGRAATLLAGAEPPAEPATAYAQRPWPIFIAAAWKGLPQRPWDGLEDSPVKRLFAGVVDRLLADREASVIDALNDTTAALGIEQRLGDDPGFDRDICNLLGQALAHVQQTDRIELVRALADARLPLVVCGSGWRELLGERDRVTYLDPVSFRELPQFYAQAKVVLNLNAGNGACERAIQAAAAGAAVVTDYSRDLAELFEPGRDVAVFDRAQPAQAAELAAALLESADGERFADSARARVVQGGLWRHRAEQLVAYLARGALADDQVQALRRPIIQPLRSDDLRFHDGGAVLASEAARDQIVEVVAIAEALLGQGRAQEALEALLALDALAPDDAEVLMRLGDALVALERHDEAAVRYAEAAGLIGSR